MRLVVLSIWLAATSFATQAVVGGAGESIANLQARLLSDPTWADGWQQLGIALADEGRYGEARSCFGKLAALRPEEGDGLALLGLAEFRERRYEAALTYLEQARPRQFRTPGLRALLDYHAALLMVRRGDFDAARKLLARLATQGATSTQLTEAEGLAALRLRKLPEELGAEDRAAVLDVGSLVVETRSMRLVEAQQRWLNLISRNARLPGVHYAYGQFLVAAGKLPDAVGAFEAELEISQNDALAAAQVAACQLIVGPPEAGLRYALKAIALDPALFAGHLLAGRALLDLDRASEAIAPLKRAAALAPENISIFIALRNAYSRLGRKAEANRAIAEAARLQRIEAERMAAARPED